MKRNFKIQEIERALARMKKETPEPVVFDRVWYKLEDRIQSRTRPQHIVWKPWGHPVRWVALAACLCVAVTGVLVQQQANENNEVASYLVNVSNPMATISHDQNIVKVSALLSDSPSSVPEMSDEVHIDSLATDEIFL